MEAITKDSSTPMKSTDKATTTGKTAKSMKASGSTIRCKAKASLPGVPETSMKVLL